MEKALLIKYSGSVKEMTCAWCGHEGLFKSRYYVDRSDLHTKGEYFACPKCNSDCSLESPMDYTDNYSNMTGLSEYLQYTAGFHPICRPFLMLPHEEIYGKKFLDVGGGCGIAAAFLKDMFEAEVTVVDPSFPKSLDVFGLDIRQEYYHPKNFDKVDVVFASEVIEHVPSPKEFLQMMIDGTHEGKAIFTTPRAEKYHEEEHDEVTIYSCYTPTHHLNIATTQGLKELMRDLPHQIAPNGHGNFGFVNMPPLVSDRLQVFERWLFKLLEHKNRDVQLGAFYRLHELLCNTGKYAVAVEFKLLERFKKLGGEYSPCWIPMLTSETIKQKDIGKLKELLINLKDLARKEINMVAHRAVPVVESTIKSLEQSNGST